jgi:cobalt-zinc-cadmium efflux system protein
VAEHHHDHDHDHGHHHGLGHHHHEHADMRSLRIAIVLTALVFFAQLIGGFVSHSLALLSDAGHVFVDMASLVIAFVGLRIAARSRERHDARYTFGMRRIEILAAMTNGFLLLGICVYILLEAIERFMEPEIVDAPVMLWIAVIGFVANAVSALLLFRSSHITTRSAYLHVLTDMLSSLGVIVAAILLQMTQWMWIDPAISVAIALFIMRGAVRVIRDAGTILMESSPPHIPPVQVRETLLAVDGVSDVHDVHVWQLGSKDYAASAHVVSSRATDDVVMAARAVLRERFDLHHVTIQVEQHDMHDDCGGCDA